MVVRYDDKGNQIEKYYSVEPRGGNDVYLTIDIRLQLAAEEGLRENVEMLQHSDAGAVTALDPNTGKVLAIASYPTYDLSQFDRIDYYQTLLQDENLPLYNRALQGVYAPGSTYKIGAALAALEQGQIGESNHVTCYGEYPLYHKPTCLANHGSVDVVDAIRESCNVFFYYLGDAMGIDAMTDYTRRLGLGVATGIELNEKAGIVAGADYRQQMGLAAWQKGDDLSASIGQSDHGYTPLQLSVYLSTVINGGTRYRTHVLDSVRTFYTGETVKNESSQILDQISFSKETYNILMEGMAQVVSGSASLRDSFSSVPVQVGGKTGTAEVEGKRDYAIFSGFAPLDTPEIVVSCIIEEGEHGYSAAHAVAKVMEQYFAQMSSSEE
jgi:penicillin-binding protein 2